MSAMPLRMPFHMSTPLIRVCDGIDLDLDAALGGLLDLLDPGLQRVGRAPAGRRILVGEGELDFLRVRRAGPRNASAAAIRPPKASILPLEHLLLLPQKALF